MFERKDPLDSILSESSYKNVMGQLSNQYYKFKTNDISFNKNLTENYLSCLNPTVKPGRSQNLISELEKIIDKY